MRTLLVFVVLTLSLGAMAQTQHGILNNWTNVGSPASNNVYSSTKSGGPYNKIFSSTAPITTYLDPLTNANSGIKTCYVVSSVFPVTGESAFSNESCATFPMFPIAPTGLSATSQ